MVNSIQIALDCADPHTLAEFWSEALGYTIESDPSFIRQMLDEGYATEADVTEHRGTLVWRDAAACVDPDGRLPRLYLQRVPEGRQGKNRMHLDLNLSADGRDDEVERLVALGATRLYDGQQGPHTWVTMADPEGNEFCVQ